MQDQWINEGIQLSFRLIYSTKQVIGHGAFFHTVRPTYQQPTTEQYVPEMKQGVNTNRDGMDIALFNNRKMMKKNATGFISI